MILQFGDSIFEGYTAPLTWGTTTEMDYAQIPIINGKPVIQVTGEKLQEPEFQVLYSDEFCSPKTEIDRLEKYVRNKNVFYLIGGDGVNYGKYVLCSVVKGFSRIDNTGYISQISATLKFLEYNTTRIVTYAGAALSSSNPKPVEPLTPLPSKVGLAQSEIQKGGLIVKSLSSDTKSSTLKFSDIARKCDEAKALFTSANDRIQDTKKVIRRAMDLKDSIQNVKDALTAMKTASQIKSPEDLYAANTVLERSMYHLNGASVPITAFVGSREAGE